MHFPWRQTLLFSTSVAFGQMNTGEIAGSLHDATGAFLPGATIVALQSETGQKFTAVSNSSGEYLFAQLPVGVYAVSANAINFKQAALRRIEVHAGDRLRHDFTLEIGDRTEVVTVQIESAGVQLESAEIRDTIGRQQMVDLPVKGRQFLDLQVFVRAVVAPRLLRPLGIVDLRSPDLVRPCIRVGCDQHAIDHAKDSGRGPDSQRQRYQRHQGEARAFP